MWGLLRRALVEPGAVLASGEATPRRTAGVLGATALTCLGPIPLVVALLESDRVPDQAVGSLPALVYAAGEAAISVPGLYALIVGLTAAIPLVLVAVYATAFHALSWPFAETGTLRATARATVWGLLPQTLGSALAVAVLYAVYALGVWPLGIQVTLPARVALVRPDPGVAWLAFEAIGGLAVVWTGYAWIDGLAAVRGTSRSRAALAVAVPLLVAVVLTPPGVRLVNWIAVSVAGAG